MNIVFLALIFEGMGTAINVLVSFLVARFGNWLQQQPRFNKWQPRITGLIFLLLGLNLLLQHAE